MENHSFRRLHCDGSGVGDGVADGDQLEAERPVIDPLLDLDLPEIGFDAELVDPAPGQLDGEFGPVDGDIHLPQEVGESAGVILMAMGQDDTFDIARSSR